MTTKTLRLGCAAFKSGRSRNGQGCRGASTFCVQMFHCARSILASCPAGLRMARCYKWKVRAATAAGLLLLWVLSLDGDRGRERQ